MGKYEFFDSYYYGIIGTIIIIGLILILMIVWFGYNVLDELRRQNYMLQENFKKKEKNEEKL
jgi:hypothetical protein